MKARWLILPCVLLAVFSGSRAGNRNTYPLPEERGTAGTLAVLEKLPVYARLLQTTAHPDDESAGALTWLSREYHARTALFCLTRGEGGQNILGGEKYDELGLVRTGELLEACKYYGVELYFGKVLDFGFSKNAEETLSKWGREQTLGDLVRFIRIWRPDVIVSRFQGRPSDGHGHHQAAGILSREAFRAAADPQSYPGQLKDGLGVWQAKKLYVSGSPSDWTVRVPTGDYDPVLGRSVREIAMEGYSKHRSQGSGSLYASPGSAFEYFRLEESLVGQKSREDGFFDSINTALTAIGELAGHETPSVAFLQADLAAAEQSASRALQSFQAAFPERSAAAVSQGIAILSDTIRKVRNSSISAPAKGLLLDALENKRQDFREALNAVLGIRLVVRTEDATGVPGETQQVGVDFHNRGPEPVSLKSVRLTAPGTVAPAGANPPFGEIAPASTGAYRYSIAISPGAAATEPFWHLESITDARYATRPGGGEFDPFGRPEISAEVVYAYRNAEVPVHVVASAQAGDPLRGSDFVEFQLVPAISVLLQPASQIAPIGTGSKGYRFRVSVVNNQKGETRGTLRLRSKPGLQIQPSGAEFKLSRKGESFACAFTVRVPAVTQPGDYPVEATATVNGSEYGRGYHVISYPENWTRHFFLSARSTLRRFDVGIASNLSAGYIPGAGDDVPGALEQLGVKVQTLSAPDLAFGDLSRFNVIVTGIRAYNVNEDLRANNRRLLDYVAAGGTLIVQYVRPMDRPGPGGTGSPFIFGPYPMSVSDADRITVEDSPVRILDPGNPVFSRPNKISEADFRGWLQERGLYFMNSWDPRYKALLSGSDPGEDAKNGGMLYARYGKGHYIYTGCSWFRQLPAGVPGAFRIFANMLSLGSPEAAKRK